jgi:hypothetical protein
MTMTIRCVYDSEPSFPATNQHPDAVRYVVGAYYVDAIGAEPTVQEVLDFLRPPSATAEAERIAAIQADAMTIDLVTRLRQATPAQISGYVDANVVDLASARALFKRILLVLAYSIR